jgi:hypothetical protein
MARRRGELISVYVEMGASKYKYGFNTTKSVHTKHKDALGQTTYAGSAGVFFGANAPKPSRASKEEASGTVSSFCSTAKIDTLKKALWTITNTRIRGIKTAGKTRTVYVDMPGNWKYAWNITAAEATDLAADLGFQLATGANASSLIWGVNSPKPPRASKRVATDVGAETHSSFIKPQASVIEAAIAKGYAISNIDYDLVPNAAP